MTHDEKLRLRGMIAEKRENLAELAAIIERAQGNLLQYTASYLPIEDIRIDLAESSFKDLKASVESYRATEMEIRRLEGEL